MNKEELHSFIEKQQPNICQIGSVDDKAMDYLLRSSQFQFQTKY